MSEKKPVKKHKAILIDDYDFFISFIKSREDCKNINFDNDVYLKEYFDYMKGESYKVVEMNKKLRSFIISKRTKRGSSLSKEFWISYGWCFDDEELNNKLNDIQKERSIWSIKYWERKGLSEEQSKSVIRIYQQENYNKKNIKYTSEELSLRCHFGKQYWKQKGLSDEESLFNVRKSNPSCIEFYNNTDEYFERLKCISEEVKIRWDKGLYDNSFDNGKNQSKEEIIFFEYICKFSTFIKHTPFFICINGDKTVRYVYDGYYKEDDCKDIILIEYDGLFYKYHIKEEDDIRDSNVFLNRKDIIGIIRVSNIYYKKNKQQINNEIHESINKIKNKKYQTIRLY